MGYEDAPQTRMLATDCAVCGRPLCDAKSVEIGIGPECRKRTGYNAIHECSEEAREEANKLIYKIAVQQSGPEVVDSCTRLFELGFSKLVVAIMKRVATVQVAITDDTCEFGPGLLAVKVPYDPDTLPMLRQVPGRRWDPKMKRNLYPQASKGVLYRVFMDLYPSHPGMGPKGPFVIPVAK